MTRRIARNDLWAAVLVLIAAPSSIFADDLPTGAEVMDKITEASGGLEAMEKITSAITRGTMEVEGLGLSGAITTWTQPPGKVRAEIELPGVGTIERGAKDGVAWETNPLSGARLLDGEEREMMLLESDLGWTSDWRAYYESAECTGFEEVNGQPCVVLALKFKSGSDQTMAVNRETWLPATSNMTMDMQGSSIPVAITYDEYKEFDGLTLPVQITQHVLVQTIKIRFDSYEFNAEIPEDRFALPEAVRALVAQDESPESEDAAAPDSAGEDDDTDSSEDDSEG